MTGPIVVAEADVVDRRAPKSTVAVIEELRERFPGVIEAYSIDEKYVWFKVTDRACFFAHFPSAINHRRTAVYSAV